MEYLLRQYQNGASYMEKRGINKHGIGKTTRKEQGFQFHPRSACGYRKLHVPSR